MMVGDRFPGSIPPIMVPAIFGLAVTVMIYAVGHISGAHFNPVVTLAFAFARHFPKREVLPYWIAQFGGSLFALILLTFILPAGIKFGVTLPAVSMLQALAWETVLTFGLVFVIISVATDVRAEGMMAGIAIGATVMINAWIGGAITGASMNPARSLAPALFQGEFSNLWIYFIGPVLGAILAAVTYEVIRCENVDTLKTEQAKGCC